MIQRVQSLYLLVAAIGACLSAFVFPLWNSEGTDVFAGNLGYLFALILGIAVLSFMTIFLFKNRGLQMKLCILSMVLTIAVAGLIPYEMTQLAAVSNPGIGTYGLIIPLLFNFLARKGIKKDDDLVKSVDRIR